MEEITIYHFDHFYKFYIKSEKYRKETGFSLPANTTDIQPPLLICIKGYIPVFHDGKWVKPTTVIKTYYTGEPSENYRPIILSSLNGDFSIYPDLPQVCNTSLVSTLISQKIRAAQAKYKEAKELYYSIKDNPTKNFVPIDGAGQLTQYAELPSNTHQYHFLVEEMVMYIRSTLDLFVQLTYVLTNFDDYMKTMKIDKDKIGAIYSKKQTGTDFEKIFLGDNKDYKKEPNDNSFLEVINELSNSMKHSMIHSEAYSSFGKDFPTVVSFYAHYNDHKQTIHLHHYSLGQIILGFQKTVLRILHNQKVYLKKQSTYHKVGKLCSAKYNYSNQ